MTQQQRRRLNSISDNSTPSSDISEGSETQEWHQLESPNAETLNLRLDNLSLDTCHSTEVTENERMQIESFFSGLGTEVSDFGFDSWLAVTSKKRLQRTQL